jgi:hypothetical protein
MLMMFINVGICVINFKFIKLLLYHFHGEFVLNDYLLLEIHSLELLLQLLHVLLLLKIIILHCVDDMLL